MDWDHVGEQEPNQGGGGGATASTAIPAHRAAEEMRRAFTDPAEYAELASKMINLKDLMKLLSFSGELSDWPEWKFRAEAIWTLLGLKEVLKWAGCC